MLAGNAPEKYFGRFLADGGSFPKVGYEAGYFNDVAKRSAIGLQDMLEFLDDGLGLGNLLSQDASAADMPQHDRGINPMRCVIPAEADRPVMGTNLS